MAVRRDTGEKLIINRGDAAKELSELLETIHSSMLAKAENDLKTHLKVTKSWTEFQSLLEAKNIMMSPFCGEIECENKIKADSAREDGEGDQQAPAMGAKSLCIPFEQPTTIQSNDKCIHPDCKDKPKFYTLFGRSY